MTCPHCNGTGEVFAPLPFEPGRLVWAEPRDVIEWQRAAAAGLYGVEDAIHAEDSATARALAETEHLGEAP